MRREDVFKHILFFLVFVFLFFVETIIKIDTFAIAFFMALVYCRQNVLVITPSYLLASLIFGVSFISILLTSIPCVLIPILYFAHYKVGKNIRFPHIVVYLCISIIPQIAVSYISESKTLIEVLISIIISIVVLRISSVALYGILVKRLKFKFTTEENLAISTWLAIIGIGFFALKIYFFESYYAILCATLLFTIFIDKRKILAVAAFMGLGAMLSVQDVTIIAISITYGLVAMFFTKETHFFAGIAMSGADLLFRIAFTTNVSALSLIAPLSATIIISSIPYKLKLKLEFHALTYKNKPASRSIINRERKYMVEKLKTLADIFYDICSNLNKQNIPPDEKSKTLIIARDVCLHCCKSCPYFKSCEDSVSGEIESIVIGLVEASLDSGRATILEAPPVLTSRCKKIHALIACVNDSINRLQKSADFICEAQSGRSVLARQMCGVGDTLNALQAEITPELHYDMHLEELLITELNANNISTGDVAVYTSNGDNYSTSIALSEHDTNNPLITEIVSAALGTVMEIVDTEKTINGMSILRFAKSTRYKVVYGDRIRAKSSDGISGDRHRAIKLTHGKVLLILSDGMGSGKSANANSAYALNLIENFYRAGFDYQTIAETIGSILSLRDSEEFSAIDIALIDTIDGSVDFIKMGGRESFIIDHGTITVVECGSLPIGILDDIPSPLVARHKLTSGSFIIMLSDGVIDVLGRDGILELISDIHTGNPDTIANMIMLDYDRLIEECPLKRDDASIVVAKVFMPLEVKTSERKHKRKVRHLK
ncbi:MAG: SpoIIE family protein phosphatase [Christensenellaceae bacterium]|jgi:stage II sporulation protein E|nr:SpoIIE family protein phosphatase [Christensenellaceae bacterium]